MCGVAFQESSEVVQKLSHLVKCSPSQFSMCGTKDKFAITTQQVTVKGITAKRSGPMAELLGHMTSMWYMYADWPRLGNT